MSSGLIRRVHVEILRLVMLDDVQRDAYTFEYHISKRRRHVSEAVYLLERVEFVELQKDGSVTITDKGESYLNRRLNEQLPHGIAPSTIQRLII